MTGKTAPKRKMPSKKPTAAAKATSGGQKAPKPSRSVVEPPKKTRNIPVVGIAFGVIAILLVAAVTLGGNSGPGGAFGEPTVEGNPLTQFRATAGDDSVGLQAPVITGENFAGETVRLRSLGCRLGSTPVAELRA